MALGAAGSGGGAALAPGGPLTVAGGSVITKNFASLEGGGVHRGGESVTITGRGSRVSGNSPEDIFPALP